jgi:hypothetical protein
MLIQIILHTQIKFRMAQQMSFTIQWISATETREEVEVLQDPEMFEPRYNILWFVNNEQTYLIRNMRLNRVYNEGVPPEALNSEPGNRWHVLTQPVAYEKLVEIFPGGSFVLCYQESLEGFDTERIVIERVGMQG